MTSCPMNSGCVLAGWVCVALLTAMPASAGFPAKNVSLYAHLTVQDFEAEFAEDSWGYVSASGREYAIIGLSTGTGFVEITDPANPVIIDVVLTPNQGRDMKVYQHYVYSSSDSGPFHIINIQGIDNGHLLLANTIEGGTHNISINEQSGFLYASTGGVMAVLSLADPVNPELVAIWEGQAHDALVVTYTEGRYAGREIAFVFAGSSHNVDIVDVTDKADMFLVGSTTYPNAAYTHQGWLSGDRRYLYVSDELDDIQRTNILDVSDLSNPFPIGEFTTGLPSTDHNLYVRDGFVFEANYTSGLRVFNACDPVNPVEVGFFDTFPANNNPGFSGAWNAYPFFPSGTVIVSDRSGGLFILDASAAVGGGCSPGNLADLDGDGDVDIFDLLLLLSDWGACQVPPDGCPADLDGDGTVGILDLLILLANWG